MDFFNAPLYAWYASNRRDLPWRNSDDPYFIWLSEIILQQTRVDQGLAYYLRFTEAFPTINDLANATEDQVLKLWQGLGYYSRARNLHATAKYIVGNFNGVFPNQYEQIRSLIGIGDYTAAAIASIAFGQEYPTLDSNVYRVLSRFFGITEPIDTPAGKRLFRDLAASLIKGTDPATHNQALMEFGALHCTPAKPACTQCPVAEKCFALANQQIDSLPVKSAKTSQRQRYFTYIVAFRDGYTWLKRRTGNDIWKNLFEFPVIETNSKTEIAELLESGQIQKTTNCTISGIENVSSWKTHILTHQRIHYQFVQVSVKNEMSPADGFVRVSKEDIFNFAVPKLLDNYINEVLFIQ